MTQDFLDLNENVVGQLTGPWWLNDTAIVPDKEQAPQEAFFRVEFARGAELKFRLATSDYYQVWLNGRWLGCGPARASHGRLTVDAWELPAAWLEEKSTLAVQIFWEGVFTFDHVRGTPGLWFSLAGAGGEIDADVLVTEQTGRLPSGRFSHQRGWIEEIDGRKRTAAWPAGPWTHADWRKPVLRTVDRAIVLEARDIKAFASAPVRAQQVSFTGSGDLKKCTKHRGMFYAPASGYAASDDVPSNVMQEEALEPAQATDVNVSALSHGGAGIAVLGPDARGLDRTVQLNFGKLVTGTLSLTLEAPAGTIVDFAWSEGRWNDADMGSWARSAQPGGSAPSQELNDARQGMRYICAGGGVETFHSLFLAALHNLRIAFRSPQAGAAIRVHDCTVFTRGYPIAQEGMFTCSDEAINRIHTALIYTLSCSVDDVYMDCPGRERGSYPNDSYFTSLGFLDVTGDFTFDRRFLRQFIHGQEESRLEGVVPPTYPGDSGRWTGWGTERDYFIIGHHLFWMIQCERHLRLFGDAALKEKWKPAMEKGVAAINKFRNAEGLLENVPWDTYFDWSSYETKPIPTGDNFLYALTLKQLGELYADEEWIAQGRQTAEAIERLAWNPERELYADTVARTDDGLRPGTSFSAVINYVALWSGLTDPAHAARAWRQMRDFRPLTVSRPLFHYETNFSRANMVGLMYRFGYQGRRGEIAELIRDLREAYEPMFARGQATIGELLGYQGSLCHGYNSYVLHLLNRHVAGIELPDQPGGLIRIRPHPDILAWCQARVCWMGGHVQVWWSRAGDDVEVMISVPAGQKGELLLSGTAPLAFTGSLHTKMTFIQR